MKIVLVLLLLCAASTAYGEIYTWKGAGGTTYYSNSLSDIPARYLKKARVLDVATGKLGGPATALPAAPGVPAAGQPEQPPAASARPVPPPGSPPAAVAPAAVAPAAPAAGVTKPHRVPPVPHTRPHGPQPAIMGHKKA